MALTVTLEISDEELDWFRSVMARTRALRNGRTDAEIVDAAKTEVSRLATTARSTFVRRRIDRVARLIAMLDDPQWQLPESERHRVLEGLSYVADAHDLVPDGVPVFGLLDDAIMLELVLRDLRHELDAYEDFDAFRAAEAARAGRSVMAAISRQDWLDSQRELLHSRIRERRDRELATQGGGLGLITRF